MLQKYAKHGRIAELFSNRTCIFFRINFNSVAFFSFFSSRLLCFQFPAIIHYTTLISLVAEVQAFDYLGTARARGLFTSVSVREAVFQRSIAVVLIISPQAS